MKKNIFFLFQLLVVASHAQNLGTDVLIGNASGGYSEAENSVFISPLTTTPSSMNVLNANMRLVGTNPFVLDAFTTTNGATSWGNGTTLSGTLGDPSVVIDRNGYYYVSASVGSMVIYKSTNNGATYPNSYTESSASDKGHLWVDNQVYKADGTTNTLQGHIYAGHNPPNGSGIKFSYSTDGAQTWATEQQIDATFSSTYDDLGVNLQTGSNGEVYACWAMHTGHAPNIIETAIGFNRSLDGGVTWSDAGHSNNAWKAIDNISGFAEQGSLCNGGTSNKTMRVYSFPSMTVNQQNGNIFIVWTNYSGYSGSGCAATCGTCTNFPTGCDCDPDIYMIRSIDKGNSWTAPIRVNAHSNTNDQWFPWIACDEASGALVCEYYDSRDFTTSPNINNKANTYVSISYDQGDTWTDVLISDVSWDGIGMGGGAFAGDYIGIDAYHGYAVPVWTDDRTSTGGGQLLAYANPFEISCPSALDLTLYNTSITDNVAYKTSNTINVSSASHPYVITSVGNSIMQAVSSITLNEGFECNGQFTADIGSCTNFSQRVNNNSSSQSSDISQATGFPVRIFPNPSSDRKFKSYIPLMDEDDQNKTESTKASICIYNSMGSIVYRCEAHELVSEIDLSSQLPGLYLIKVVKGDKVYNGKIVLQ